MADWNSIYGINRGVAQVWSGNAGLDALENQFKQEQLKKQKEEAQLQAELAKVNYDKVRNTDIPKTVELYGDILNTFGKIRSTEDKQERINLTNEMRSKQAELSHFIGTSRQALQAELQYDKTRIDKYDEVDEKAHDKLKALKSLPITDSRYATLAEDLVKTFLAKPFDESKLLKEAQAFSADQVKSPVRTRGLGDATQYYEEVGEQFNPNKFRSFVIEKAKTDKSLMKYLAVNYEGKSMAEAIDSYVADKAPIMSSLYKVESKSLMTDKPSDAMANFYAREAYKIANGDGESNPYDVAPSAKVFYKNKKNTNGDVVTDTNGNPVKAPTAEFAKFATVTPVSFESPQLASVYNVAEGRNESNVNFDKAFVTGLGYSLVKGGKYQLKASINDKNGNEYLVNFNDLPLKAKDDKYVKALVNKLGSAPQPKQASQQTQSSQKTTSKTSTFRNIPKGGF